MAAEILIRTTVERVDAIIRRVEADVLACPGNHHCDCRLIQAFIADVEDGLLLLTGAPFVAGRDLGDESDGGRS